MKIFNIILIALAVISFKVFGFAGTFRGIFHYFPILATLTLIAMFLYNATSLAYFIHRKRTQKEFMRRRKYFRDRATKQKEEALKKVHNKQKKGKK